MRCIRRSQVAGLLVARGVLLPRRIPLCVFYALLLLIVSACSFGDKESAVKRASPPPAATEKNQLIASMAAMPSAMDTFRALAPPEGLRFTPLFDEQLEDSNARLQRLEATVQTLRNDLDTVVPTMVRMVAIEQDIKGLVAQLQTLTDQGPAVPVPAVTPQELPPALPGGNEIPGEGAVEGTRPAEADKAPAGSDTSTSLVTPEAALKGELPPEGAASPFSTTAPPSGSTTAPPSGSTTAPPSASTAPVDLTPQPQPAETQAPTTVGDAKAIRIADYPEKTRVVVDTTAASGMTARIENDGRTLVITLPQLNWLGEKSWDAETAQLISGYRVEEGNLHVDLMYAAQIKSQSVLNPSDANKDHRLVIDLFSPEVHK